jgi:hypothetical protein
MSALILNLSLGDQAKNRKCLEMKTTFNGLQHQIIKSGISQHPQIKSFSIFENEA